MLPVSFDTVTYRIATENDMHLPSFDFTKLTAINTCPRWGLVRYHEHKRMPGEGRAMALDLGAAAHDAFAALRVYQLLKFGTEYYGDSFSMELLTDTGNRIFGTDRFAKMLEQYTSTEHEDERQRMLSFLYYVLGTSGFYDDPGEKRKTMSNLETSIAMYAERQVLDSDVPFMDPFTRIVGIEVPFNIVVEFGYGLGGGSKYAIRLVGRIDGLSYGADKNSVEVHENKTASRLDAAWHMQWYISHQVSTYTIAAELLTGLPCVAGYAIGLMCPLPKTYDLGGYSREPFDRTAERKEQWLKWVWHTLRVFDDYKDNPLEAPEYSHSCNRYFRPCAFIPLCAQYGEDRQQVYDQMETEEWNPLDERA